MQIIRLFSKKAPLIQGISGDWVAMRDHETFKCVLIRALPNILCLWQL